MEEVSDGLTPEVAVVIPCFNAVNTLPRAMNSVLSQEGVRFEVIVVDDGSTDRTADIAAAIAAQDQRVTLLRQEIRGGANRARNAGVRASRAGIISFLDADDEYLAGKLAHAVSFFAAHPGTDVLLDSYLHVKDGENRRRVAPDLTRSEDVLAGILMREINKPTSAISARRSALLAAGLFDESQKRRQDLSLLLRLNEAGARFASASRILWHRHSTPGSISATCKTSLPALRQLCEAHPVYLGNPRYRAGAARDFAHGLWKLVVAGRLPLAFREYRLFARSQGEALTARLAVSGTAHLLGHAALGFGARFPAPAGRVPSARPSPAPGSD